MSTYSRGMIDRDAIARTAAAIAPFIRRTPVVEVEGRDLRIDVPRIQLKLELLQHAGSFKTRGAFANLLAREVPAAGIAAASGGNHGAAVAYAAWRRGVPATIFIPTIAPPAKVDRIRRYGARLQIGGDRYADALAACDEHIARTGAMDIHAFDQIDTLLGTGTLARELEEQVAVDTVLVAVGGGGLIGGIAAWYGGTARVIAVEPEGAPTLHMAMEAGRIVDAPAGGYAADSLAPRRVGELMFPIAQQFVERVVLVSDAAILAAQRALWDGLTIVAEPGGAAALSALLSKRYVPAPGERVAVVVSGGNSAAVSL